MGKPIIHAQSSARKFGGKTIDYLKIHEFIDSSASAFSDVRHRALTHTSWFLRTILPLVFGPVIRNSGEKVVSVIDIAERHVLEDYGQKFIPDAHDFLTLIPLQEWMTTGKHGAYPPSHENARITQKKAKLRRSKRERPESNFHTFLLPDGKKVRMKKVKTLPLNDLDSTEEITGHKRCNLD